MSQSQNENPLTDGLLDGAQYLCFRKAVFTSRDVTSRDGVFLPGSGDYLCHSLHQRSDRFKQARDKMKAGTTSLFELGLLAQDCLWAKLQSEEAKDPEDWRSRFKQAEDMLKNAD